MTIVLGINAAYHESAAAIVRDGEVLLAVEEERFSRIKHAKQAAVSNPDELPWAAIEACLDAAGVRLVDVDRVGYSLQPAVRLAMAGIDAYPVTDPDGWGTAVGEAEFDRRVRSVPALLAARAGDASVAGRVAFIPHHLAHAACAFFGGPFDSAAALVADGIGEMSTTWLGVGGGETLQRLDEVPYPHSLGLLWEQLAAYLGFGAADAGKAMGLAAYGDPRRFASALDQLFCVPDPAGGQPGSALPPFFIDGARAGFRKGLGGFEALFGPRRRPEEPLPATQRFADVAAAIQHRTEEALLAACRRLQRVSQQDRLVYAGGVALNCVANARLEREGPFAEIYITGPAHDAGTALGAAWALCPQKPSRCAQRGPPGPLLGPSYDGAQIDAALAAADVPVKRVADPPREAASLLAAGQVVGWFQGRLELGPRALGNRSLLADPRRSEMRETLNRRVKHREPFRPFAASCLAELADEWFEIPAGRPGARHSRELMLLAYRVRAERAAAIAAVVHRDGSCRLQTVDAARQPQYHALIRHFYELTGTPLVLNTSFNDREPIVCSPAQALQTFHSTTIDAVFLEDRLVRRR